MHGHPQTRPHPRLQAGHPLRRGHVLPDAPRRPRREPRPQGPHLHAIEVLRDTLPHDRQPTHRHLRAESPTRSRLPSSAARQPEPTSAVRSCTRTTKIPTPSANSPRHQGPHAPPPRPLPRQAEQALVARGAKSTSPPPARMPPNDSLDPPRPRRHPAHQVEVDGGRGNPPQPVPDRKRHRVPRIRPRRVHRPARRRRAVAHRQADHPQEPPRNRQDLPARGHRRRLQRRPGNDHPPRPRLLAGQIHAGRGLHHRRQFRLRRYRPPGARHQRGQLPLRHGPGRVHIALVGIEKIIPPTATSRCS